MADKEITDFIEILCHDSALASAFLSMHLEENYDELLPYVFVEQLTDKLIAEIHDDNDDNIKNFLAIVDTTLPNASRDLSVLINTSVAETIDSHLKDRVAHRKVLENCGPHLRSMLMFL